MPALRDRLTLQRVPKDLLINLTQRELKGKFKRSALGYLWSVINPAVNLAVYAVVFGVFLKVDPATGEPSGLHNYAFFLVCALLPWTFLTNSLGGAAGSLVANESLVKKVYFPRSVLPASVICSFLISFLIEMAVLCIALLIVGNMVIPWIVPLVALIAIEFVFLLGLGLFLAVANAYFRDVTHFLAIFLNVWFYATPILYKPELIPETVHAFGLGIPARTILLLNPMAYFVDAYRDVLYHLRAPTVHQWIYLVLCAVVALLLGMFSFKRLEPRLAEEL